MKLQWVFSVVKKISVLLYPVHNLTNASYKNILYYYSHICFEDPDAISCEVLQ